VTSPAEAAAADREGELAQLNMDGFKAQRCNICDGPDPVEPHAGVMDKSDRTSDRAVIWQCLNRACQAERKMPWPVKRSP